MNGKAPGLTKNQRRILILAAGQLGGAVANEREIALKRVNAELKRLNVSWIDIFERGLPDADEPKSSTAEGDVARRSTEAPAPTREPRRLTGDEIPRIVGGRVGEIDERPWNDGTMMFVTVTNRDFVYGPMIVFEESSQRAIHAAVGRDVVGRVEHSGNPNQTPVLHTVTID